MRAVSTPEMATVNALAVVLITARHGYKDLDAVMEVLTMTFDLFDTEPQAAAEIWLLTWAAQHGGITVRVGELDPSNSFHSLFMLKFPHVTHYAKTTSGIEKWACGPHND